MNDHIEQPAFLTTKEVAELLRIKERKLYDLVSAQEIPCVKATGKLLFPRAELLHWIHTGELLRGEPTHTNRPAVVCGSHEPLLEWAIGESGCGLATQFNGSLNGLDSFENQLGMATGLHVINDNSPGWNTELVQARFKRGNVVLVQWATRQQGLVVAKHNPKRIQTLKDLVNCKVAIRQHGAGGMILFQQLLKEAGLTPEDLQVTQVCRTESDSIAAVASGQADAAPGLQALAQQFGLGFVPTRQERFDLLVCRKAWFDAPMQNLLAFTRGATFQTKAAQFAGYDTTGLGQVVWNAN